MLKNPFIQRLLSTQNTIQQQLLSNTIPNTIPTTTIQPQPTMFDIVSSGSVGDLMKIYSSSHNKPIRALKMTPYLTVKSDLGSLAQNFILSTKLDMHDWEGALEELRKITSPNLFTFEIIFRSLYNSPHTICDPKKASLMSEEIFQLMSKYSIPDGGSPICWLARLSLSLPQFDGRVLELYDELVLLRPKFIGDSSLHLGLLERGISSGCWKIVYRIIDNCCPINPPSPLTKASLEKVKDFLSLSEAKSSPLFSGTAFQYNILLNQLKSNVPNPLSLPLLRFLLDQLKNYDLQEDCLHWLLVVYCFAGKKKTFDIAHFAFIRLLKLYKGSPLPPHYLRAILRCVDDDGSGSGGNGSGGSGGSGSGSGDDDVIKSINEISPMIFQGNCMKQNLLMSTDDYHVMIELSPSNRSIPMPLNYVLHRGRYGSSSTNFILKDFDHSKGLFKLKRMTQWVVGNIFKLNSSLTPAPPSPIYEEIIDKVRRLMLK